MSRRKIFIIFAILFLANAVDFGGGMAFSQNVGTIVSINERSFSIPFQVFNDNVIDKVAEVELLVSKDRGTRWYSVGRKPIDEKFFLFEADSDGEYWFSFRTVTASGAVKRSANNKPQIRVNVDTEIVNSVNSVNSAQNESLNLNANTHSNVNSNEIKSPIIKQSQSNYGSSNAGLNNYNRNRNYVAEGIIYPPKPAVFAKNAEKNIAKTQSKNEIKTITNNLPNSTDIKIDNMKTENLNLALNENNNSNNEKKEQNNSTDLADRKSLGDSLEELPFPILPDSKLLSANDKTNDNSNDSSKVNLNLNEVESNFGEVETFKGSEKISKAERKAQIIKRLFEDFMALLKDDDDNNDNNNNDVYDEIETAVVDNKSEIVNTADTAKSANNRNENSDVITKNDLVDSSVIPPSAVIAKGDEMIAKNFNVQNQAKNQVQTDDNKTNDNNSDEVRGVGKVLITGVTMNVATEQNQIIVKWSCGDFVTAGKLADVMRAESVNGEWKPIAVGIPNNGEYWWYVSPEDKKLPFYLMIRTRNSIEIIGEDITKSPITVP
ncbi:MAG: hypothetical protein LBB88_00515 [Planctomycetaceae bacterium]|jgi:hypothetical protein|nr:hypothetical protein [Planctomycetaceae bacterium]